ncbi:hypothetical protein O6H91_Y345200 [Diphasiastrum complanatum]|nr:hypothetical protein O6H91_Y345200 [Diphasiastrum complanatum]
MLTHFTVYDKMMLNNGNLSSSEERLATASTPPASADITATLSLSQIVDGFRWKGETGHRKTQFMDSVTAAVGGEAAFHSSQEATQAQAFSPTSPIAPESKVRRRLESSVGSQKGHFEVLPMANTSQDNKNIASVPGEKLDYGDSRSFLGASNGEGERMIERAKNKLELTRRRQYDESRRRLDDEKDRMIPTKDNFARGESTEINFDFGIAMPNTENLRNRATVAGVTDMGQSKVTLENARAKLEAAKFYQVHKNRNSVDGLECNSASTDFVNSEPFESGGELGSHSFSSMSYEERTIHSSERLHTTTAGSSRCNLTVEGNAVELPSSISQSRLESLCEETRSQCLGDIKLGQRMMDANKTNWVPPPSPYGLIQEKVYQDPWKVLVACILLNKTGGHQVRFWLSDSVHQLI